MLQSKVSSPVANSGVSASMNGKEIASRGETNSSGSNYHDLDVVEGHEQSNNSLNAFSHRAQKGLKYRDEFDDVSRHIEHSTEAACSIKTRLSLHTPRCLPVPSRFDPQTVSFWFEKLYGQECRHGRCQCHYTYTYALKITF